MCGIFGFVGRQAAWLPGAALERCLRTLAHRGPDAEGCVAWDEAGRMIVGPPPADSHLTLALGHRRLAILDLSDAGRQPMQGPGGEWLVFNGEIYNYLELRGELSRLGHAFHTGTDTEVLLAAYRQWGTDCTARFNGMWAFALYDPARGGVFFSRDRLGVKPLYYVREDDRFCFASEPAAIFAAREQTPAIDADQLAKYVVFGACDDGEATLYRGVRELRGAHSAWLDLATGQMRLWRWWSLPEAADLELDDRQALEQFSELFEDAVRLRLRADVPVAITLSGGTDSSAVTVAASRVHEGEILTFTSAFPESPQIDETRYAQAVAARRGVRSVLVRPDLSRMIDQEPALTRHQSLPYGSLSLYVHWAILQRIREQGVPVVLCGQGGDELFLGYEPYHVARILARWPNVPGMLADALAAHRRSQLGLGRVGLMTLYFGSPALRRASLMRRSRRVFREDLVHRAADHPWVAKTALAELHRQDLEGGELSRLLRYDDRTSSAHGMETRLPFLDYRLVEFACRLPWRHKIRHGWTKYLVRRYLAQHLPDWVAWRRRKLQFNAPDARWSQELMRARGGALLAQPFRRLLLRDELRPENLAAQQRWKVYNLLQLASLMDWREVA